MGRLRLEQVCPGMVLDVDVRDRRGRLLLSAGQPLTERALRTFRIWWVTEVGVASSDQDAAAEPALRVGLSEESRARIETLFRHADLQHPLMATLRQLSERRAGRGQGGGPPLIRCARPRLCAVPMPSPPAICQRLTEAVNDPRASAVDIADLISTDSSLTARVLRLVNSGAYGFPSRIETPWQAVMLLGTQHLCDLALTTSVASLFKNIPGELVSMTSFWRHAVGCGLAGRVLASCRGEPDADRFFVGGVLHDIGRLVFYQQAPDRAREALARSRATGELLFSSKLKVAGVDHATLGAELGGAWGLPASLVESVGCHPVPRRARRYPLEAALVHPGDILAAALEVGTSVERFVPPLEPGAWELLGLPTDVSPHVCEEVEQRLEDTARAFLGAGPS